MKTPQIQTRRKYVRGTVKERIEARLSKTTDGGCQEWEGAMVNGIPVMGGNGGGTVRRLVYEMNFGALPYTNVVGNSCGNAKCAAKNHLVVNDRGYAKYKKTLEQSMRLARSGFFEKIKISPKNQCWILGRVGRYGSIKFPPTGKLIKNTHFAWFVATGKLPTQLMCHRCDEPSCVNITHLFEGSHLENTRDMSEKMRSRVPSGSKHHKSKIGHGAAYAIRRGYIKKQETPTAIARRRAVDGASISALLKGETWNLSTEGREDRHGLPADFEPIRRECAELFFQHKLSRPRKITYGIAQRIRERYKAGGITMKQLGKDYELDGNYVSKIIYGKAWPVKPLEPLP